jgi:hypothetical protein
MATDAVCQEHSDRLTRIEVSLEHLQSQVDALSAEVREGFASMRQMMEAHYVRREEYEPVRRLVYGLVALILTGMGLAMVDVVLRHRAAA